MTLVQLSVGLAAANELDKFSLNSHSLSQRSSPANSSLLNCGDSRPSSANNNHHNDISMLERLEEADALDDDEQLESQCNNNDNALIGGGPMSMQILASSLHQNHYQPQRPSRLSLGQQTNQINNTILMSSSPSSNITSPMSCASGELNSPTQQVQLVASSLPVAAVTRRPSRCEHRKSLSDLGYGKIESYTRLQRLGKGTYATVYLGRSRLSNDLVALKEILKEHDEGAPCTAIREISLLRLLRHNNIVTLHDICHTPRKLTLVFEYVGPDLYAYMRENNNLLSISNIRVSSVVLSKQFDTKPMLLLQQQQQQQYFYN